jgi:hypothetical protein
MNKLINFVCSFCLIFISLGSKADDAVFLVSPDNLAIYKSEQKTSIDFSLTQKMQKQFFEVLDLLNKQNIKSIVANGRVESTNSYNNNWFFVYTYNNDRFLTILPQKDIHRSNIRPEYIEYLLQENSMPITKTENLYRKIDHKIFCDTSDFALDRNYRTFYFYPVDNPTEYMIKNLAKTLKANIVYLKPKAGLALKISQVINVNERIAMICPSCFQDPEAYKQLKAELIARNKTILEISEEQAASNATDFVVVNAHHLKYVLISKNSFAILGPELTKKLLDYGKLIILDLSAFAQYNKTRLADMLTIIN